MKVYTTDLLRNIALVSHQGAGKTSLVEAMLFNAGAVTRMGTVEQGTTVSDYDEEETKRGLSLSTSLIALEVKDLKLNILDTPGYTDFQGEVKSALHVVDLALMLVDASAGVEVGTEVYWGFADEFNLPRMAVVNKMDRDTVRRPQVLLDEMQNVLGGRFVALQLPMGEGGAFPGVIDLLTMKARIGADGAEADIPADLQDAADEARLALMEAAAEADDALLEKYFDVGELTDEEIWQGVRAGLLKRTFVPVVFASATGNTGVSVLTDLLVRIAPTPTEREPVKAQHAASGEQELTADDSGPLAVYIFKTMADPFVGKLTYFRIFSGMLKSDNRYFDHSKGEEERFGSLNSAQGKEQLPVDTMHAGDIGAVAKLSHATTGDTIGDKGTPITVVQPEYPKPVYAVAVTPATQADSAKMGPVLTRLCDEDATLQWHQEAATRESILEGMGDVHVDVAIKRAAHLGVGLETAVPDVPYRETVTKSSSDQYRHKKQTGGAGQFAEVHLRVEPMERDTGFEFASEVFGGAISQSFMPSIEKGIKSVLESGVIAGYPVVDVKAVVYDGKMHPVDSKDIAFQIAGREGFKLAFKGAGPVLLEPVMKLRVTVPESDMGSAIGDLTTRRAQVQGTEAISGRAVITALAPLAEIQRYSNDLRSFTQGRGVYTLELSHYQQVPSHVAEQIVANRKKEKEEEE
ncbi:MAG: elongation factor G [Anaerolineae bacterium]|nr:elongation factor G [Anaerolineae bacterium]